MDNKHEKILNFTTNQKNANKNYKYMPLNIYMLTQNKQKKN